MRIFDLHADIGCDVLYWNQQGMKNVLMQRHAEKCLSGEISSICMASYFSGEQSWEEMCEMISTLEQELNEQKVFRRVVNKEDLYADQPLALMSVEGMCGIKDDVEAKVQWMYDHGIRLASLCWNDENALACGVGNEFGPGLTELGKQVIHKMDELHMIIDVSHANPKTFDDILETSTGLVIATHSNSKTCCEHRRNLTDEQAKRLAERGGLIGMNACSYFVREDYEKASALELAKHAAYLKELVGIDHLACGFDFMDFFEEHEQSTIQDLADASMGQNFVKALKEVGFNDEELEKICFKNVIERFYAYLK